MEKFNINDILEKAAAENEKQRSVEYVESKKTEEPITESDIPDAVTGNGKAPTEADKLIGQYSQKVPKVTDEKTSTDALRESLNSSMANDKELFAYYRSVENRKKSRKVEELYNLINFATQSDIKERDDLESEKSDPVKRASHFTESKGDENGDHFSQQKFAGFEDTMIVPTDGVNKPVAEFDDEYDALSGKIESGELDFTDKTDTRQIPLISDNPVVANEKTVEITSPVVVGKNEDDENKKEQDDPSKYDTKDRDLLRVFGMISKKDAEAEKDGEKGREKKKKENAPEYEYTDRNQNSEIHEMLTKAIRSSFIRLIFTFLLCAGILYMELATKNSTMHSVYMRPGRYGQLYVAIDLELLCFIGIALLESLKNGCKGLFTHKPTGESVLFVSFAVAVIHSLLTLILDPNVKSGLICLPCAVYALVCALVKFLECRKDYHCFKVIASTRSKYVSQKLTGDTKEAIEFYKYLFDGSEIYTTKKTDFVEGFFRRLRTRPESESLSGFVILLTAIVSLGVLGYEIYAKAGAYEAITMACKTVCFALPVSSLLVVSLPVIKANRIGKKNGSAFIGNAVGEEYADASVISFADTEVYPSNLVKITSVKVFGNGRIDTILYDLAKVFATVGGPLKTVIGNMITGGFDLPQTSRLIESASDGICVAMDGCDMFLGKKEYVRNYNFEAPYDAADAEFEKKNGSVMYVTKNQELIAKVYIKYTINPQFNVLLRDLYKAGMCVGIKTTDPNITNSLIERSVKFKKTPISILKAGDVSDVEAESPRVDSGVVANASLHTFLRMFIVVDKLRHITKANGIINMISVAIAFFVSVFLVLTGQMTAIASWYTALYQIVWIVPVAIVSFLL